MTCHVNYIDSYVYCNLLSNVALKTTGNQVALNQKRKLCNNYNYIYQKTKHVNRGKREPTRKAFNVRSWIQNTNRSSSNCYFVGLFGAGQVSADPPPDWRLSTKFTEVSTKDCFFFFKVSWNHVLRSDLNPSALKEQNPNPVPHRSNRCKYDLFYQIPNQHKAACRSSVREDLWESQQNVLLQPRRTRRLLEHK